jgi:integrase
MKLQNAKVADVIEKYTRTPEFKTKIRADKTRNQYAYQLQRLCDLQLDDIPVKDIKITDLTVAKCQHIYWKIVESVGNGKGIRFANYTLQIVTRVWNVLMKYDLLEKNPWCFVERGKAAPRNTVWNTDDFTSFLGTAFGVPKWRNVGLLVRINVELGQRIEDIRLSEWQNYNLTDGLYTREVILKTNERIAGIPMSDTLVQMLTEQKEVYDFQKWVVPNPLTLEPYSEHNISRTFRKIMVAAKLPSRLQLRDIRRTVLTDLANHGATDTEIMAYSGHKSRESLMPYVCINTEQARNAANKRQFSMEESEEWKQFKRSLMTTEELLGEVEYDDE